MEHILEGLEQNIILSDEIVLNLKNDIRRSYPSADSKYRARLLSESLHERLDSHLNGLHEDLRSEVRISVFKNSIQENHINVSQMDIVQEVMQAEMKPRDLYVYMTEWFSNYTDAQLEFEQVHLMLSEINPDLATEDIFEHLNEQENTSFPTQSSISVKIRLIFNKIGSELKKIYKLKSYKLAIILLSLLMVLPIMFIANFLLEEDPSIHKISFVHASSILNYQTQLDIERSNIVHEIFYREQPGYPEFLEFVNLNYASVVDYLHSRNSSFTNEDYLEIIYAVGEEYDVHPLLLLAIIGQEQGFVPKDSPYATRILNNPFNVYTSWTNYNTNLRDSCEVAAGTIRVILRERPVGENPFRWLNTRYAEDPNWWKGVQELFYTLLAHAE